MAVFKSSHRSKKDGVVYVYFWTRILSEGQAGKGTKISSETEEIMIGGVVWRSVKGGIGDVATFVLGGFDKTRESVAIHQMPPGTSKKKAEAWIATAAGKKWKGKGLAFLSQSALSLGP